MTNEGLREGLAAHAHEQWSGWMRYIFKRCHFCSDGTVIIPAWAVKRWGQQHEADGVLAMVEAE